MTSNKMKILREKYAAWEWRFGMTPSFAVRRVRSGDRGAAAVECFVEKGVIRTARLDSPGQALENGLAGIRFDYDSIRTALARGAGTAREAEALARWIVYG